MQLAMNGCREKFKGLHDRMSSMDKASDNVRIERKHVFDNIRMNVKGLTKDVNEALKNQTKKTQASVKVVQTNAEEAASTITTMKKTVDDLPKTIKQSTKRLEIEVKNIAATVQGLLEHANVRVDRETRDTLELAATEEIEPAEVEEVEAAVEEEGAPLGPDDENKEQVGEAAVADTAAAAVTKQ